MDTVMPQSFPASSIVITNLRYVEIRGIELDCHALILSDDPDLNEGKERRYRLNGYGASCVWHVFNLWLLNAKYEWRPDKERYGFEFPQRGELLVNEREQGLTTLRLASDNRDLPITLEHITGTWTPGAQNEDWFDYCQRVGNRVFDQSCAVVEALPFQRNLLLPIAMTAPMAREIFEEDGSTIRKGLSQK